MTRPTNAPEPDTVVPYVAYASPSGKPNGALCVFGDPSSPRMALLCAGFPDDHTVFLPFAKELSREGVLVGVMCLPGFDDRPEDGVPWQSHPREGFSFDETVLSVREASKSLKGVSTHNAPEFIGIFHDWGAVSGSMWAQRLEQEAKDNAEVLRPHKMVFFDVLVGAAPTTPDLIPITTVPPPTLHQAFCCSYQVLLALCSVIQQYISIHLAAAVCISGFSFLIATGLSPLHRYDLRSTKALYGDRKPGYLRCMAMAYMYRNLIATIFTSKTIFPFHLHEDWKATPILYLYGKKKNTMYHANNSLAMLEREESEKRSLSRAVGLEEAGHFLYVQQQEECLKHVLDFIRAENTYAQ